MVARLSALVSFRGGARQSDWRGTEGATGHREPPCDCWGGRSECRQEGAGGSRRRERWGCRVTETSAREERCGRMKKEKLALGFKCKCRPPGFRSKHNRWGLWSHPPFIITIIIVSLLRSKSYATKLSPPLLDYLTTMPALSPNDPLWFVRCARAERRRRAAAGCVHEAGEYLRRKPRQLPAFACVCVHVESHFIAYCFTDGTK